HLFHRLGLFGHGLVGHGLLVCRFLDRGGRLFERRNDREFEAILGQAGGDVRLAGFGADGGDFGTGAVNAGLGRRGVAAGEQVGNRFFIDGDPLGQEAGIVDAGFGGFFGRRFLCDRFFGCGLFSGRFLGDRLRGGGLLDRGFDRRLFSGGLFGYRFLGRRSGLFDDRLGGRFLNLGRGFGRRGRLLDRGSRFFGDRFGRRLWRGLFHDWGGLRFTLRLGLRR